MAYISLQNLANRLYVKQNVCSDRRVTRLTGSPFCPARVTLLARPTFLHVNTLACPAEVSVRGPCWLGQRGQLFSHKNVRQR